MTLHAVGLNHDQATTEVREAFALDGDAIEDLYGSLALSSGAEVVLLSTCNRTEAIIHGQDGDKAAVLAALEAKSGQPWPERHAFSYEDEAAIRHVFGVTSGLRSLVIGDAQILHQSKEAYRHAVGAETVGPVLHRLMHEAFHVAKRVRTETGLAQGAASVSSLAVAVARARVPGGSLDGHRVLLLGAGQMGRAALSALSTFELGHLAISNRSAARARIAAEHHGGAVVEWNERHRAIGASDIVLVASGASTPVVRAEQLPERAADDPALVIDIAVPRNVDRSVDELPGYTVLDLDTLNREVEATAAARRSAIPEAEAIVEQSLAEYVTWFFHQQALQPTIQAIRSTFDAIRKQEIERHAHRIPKVARADVERLTKSIMQKLLAVPVVRLKATDPESLDFVRGVKALATIFSQPGYPLEPDFSAMPLNGPGLKEEGADPSAGVAIPPGSGPEAPARCPFGHDLPHSVPSDPLSVDAHRNARQ
ncbi:MAG: glutamyl-tRNA reductase [Bacteroidota bacterium]